MTTGTPSFLCAFCALLRLFIPVSMGKHGLILGAHIRRFLITRAGLRPRALNFKVLAQNRPNKEKQTLWRVGLRRADLEFREDASAGRHPPVMKPSGRIHGKSRRVAREKSGISHPSGAKGYSIGEQSRRRGAAEQPHSGPICCSGPPRPPEKDRTAQNGIARRCGGIRGQRRAAWGQGWAGWSEVFTSCRAARLWRGWAENFHRGW